MSVITYMQLKFQEKRERLGKKNIWKNSGRKILKLGENCRPTDERSTKELKQKKQKKKKNHTRAYQIPFVKKQS